MPTKINLSAVLERWQIEHHQTLTEIELAEKAGISYAALMRMITGSMLAGDTFSLLKVCQALDCDPGEILINEGFEFHPFPETVISANAAPGSIFISYRPADSSLIARRIQAHLNTRFGARAASANIAHLEDCRVVVLVIGKLWMMLSDDSGKRLLDVPDDPVRIAMFTAKARQIPVIPLLVDNAPMPDMVRRAFSIDNSNMRLDMERVIYTLTKILTLPGAEK